MTKATRLELGFVRTNASMDEVLMEILDHLGMVYREADEGDFPLLISSTKPSRASSSKSLIVAEDVLPMDEVLNALSGIKSIEDRDCFDLKINELEDRLLTLIRNCYWAKDLPLVRKWYWPNFSRACLVLTHDVDWLSYSPFHKVVYRKEPLLKFLKLIFKHLFLKKDYGYNIPEIIEVERSKGVRSTFFLKTSYSDAEKAYKVQQSLKENGFEIGLHGARRSHKELEALKEELKRLQKATRSEIHGIRHHRLKFRPGLTWRLEEDTGLKYDMTFSNNKYFGFKSQLCYPYHPIDMLLMRRLKILEIPTAFMDWTSLYRGQMLDDCISVLNKLMDVVSKYNGCLAVNFHNTYLNKETFREIYETFIWSINAAINKGFWTTTAFECCNWWLVRTNAKLTIEYHEGAILGKSSLKGVPTIVDMGDEKEVSFIADEEFKIGLKE